MDTTDSRAFSFYHQTPNTKDGVISLENYHNHGSVSNFNVGGGGVEEHDSMSRNFHKRIRSSDQVLAAVINLASINQNSLLIYFSFMLEDEFKIYISSL